MRSVLIFFCIALLGISSCKGNRAHDLQKNIAMETHIPTDTATLGGGCFWCTEAVFIRLKGVISVTSGYAGGHTVNPDYRQVCSGLSGHAEVIRIVFDPDTISYGDLLTVFFSTHDPTTLNRQGADVGTQYRSVIFFHNEKQKTIAEEMIASLNSQKIFDSPVITEISPLTAFYAAEDYHQQYYALNGSNPYCQAVISPKIKKLRERYKHLIKE